MLTRFGTNVIKTHDVDAAGYVLCDLMWEDGNCDTRDIHLGDLRTETEDDEQTLQRLNSRCREKGRLNG